MVEPPFAAPSEVISERDVLLATKLHMPRPRSDLVPRPRLAERLDEGPARFWRHGVAALDRGRPGLAGRVGPLFGPPAPASYEGRRD